MSGKKLKGYLERTLKAIYTNKIPRDLAPHVTCKEGALTPLSRMGNVLDVFYKAVPS